LDDLNLVSRFLSQQLLGITPEDATDAFTANDLTPFHVPMPEDMLTTAQLSQVLTGVSSPEGIELEDVFPPVFRGEKVDSQTLQRNVGRGDIMRVFAQFECTLCKPNNS